MVTHVGTLVNREIISEALRKQQRKFRQRALPASSRHVFAISDVLFAPTGSKQRLLLWLSSKTADSTITVAVVTQFYLGALQVCVFCPPNDRFHLKQCQLTGGS